MPHFFVKSMLIIFNWAFAKQPTVGLKVLLRRVLLLLPLLPRKLQKVLVSERLSKKADITRKIRIEGKRN